MCRAGGGEYAPWRPEQAWTRPTST
jgi:hypothetical protein